VDVGVDKRHKGSVYWRFVSIIEHRIQQTDSDQKARLHEDNCSDTSFARRQTRKLCLIITSRLNILIHSPRQT
jgi:hypothetical protein